MRLIPGPTLGGPRAPKMLARRSSGLQFTSAQIVGGATGNPPPLTPPPARATLNSNDGCPRHAGARSGAFHPQTQFLRAKPDASIHYDENDHPSRAPKLQEAAP
jgi:hypothetical protein